FVGDCMPVAQPILLYLLKLFNAQTILLDAQQNTVFIIQISNSFLDGGESFMELNVEYGRRSIPISPGVALVIFSIPVSSYSTFNITNFHCYIPDNITSSKTPEHNIITLN
ncbi:hypothetical protein ACJX0J_035026, partial [Zea mays]